MGRLSNCSTIDARNSSILMGSSVVMDNFMRYIRKPVFFLMVAIFPWCLVLPEGRSDSSGSWRGVSNRRFFGCNSTKPRCLSSFWHANILTGCQPRRVSFSSQFLCRHPRRCRIHQVSVCDALLVSRPGVRCSASLKSSSVENQWIPIPPGFTDFDRDSAP